MRMKEIDEPDVPRDEWTLRQEDIMKYLLLAADQGHELALYQTVCEPNDNEFEFDSENVGSIDLNEVLSCCRLVRLTGRV